MKILSNMLCLTGLLATPAWAQSMNALEDKLESEAAPDQAQTRRWSWGVGWLHYREPGLMRLQGPEVRWQLRDQPQRPGWPDRLELEAGVGLLRYTSTDTGSLDSVAALNGMSTALWQLSADTQPAWLGGLQLDLMWTDLRGTSTTGHRGYRRLGTKLWAVLQHEAKPRSHVQVGVLLRGRQDSWLSDAGIRDVANIQRRGLFVAYEHGPLGGKWQGVRPWIRWADVGRSEMDGIYYEPRNRLLQLGLRFDL